MKRTFGYLTKAALVTGVVLAACVPTLPGELDPQSTGAAGADGMMAGGNAGQGLISGTGGGAGTPAMCDPGCTPAPGCSDPVATHSLVSGLETACRAVAAVDGRDGGWFVVAAEGTTISPGPGNMFQVACGGAAGSCFSACISGRLSGSGYPWAILGIVPRKDARAYDVSRYRGIFFWVTGSVGTNSTLSFKVPQIADTALGNGDGACTDRCFDAYAARLFDFGRQPGLWEPRQIDFTGLQQQGFGAPAPWDPATVVGFQWHVGANAETVVDEPFMICVDQIELVE